MHPRAHRPVLPFHPADRARARPMNSVQRATMSPWPAAWNSRDSAGAGHGFNRFLQHLYVAFFAAAQFIQGGDQFFQICRAEPARAAKSLRYKPTICCRCAATFSPSPNSSAVDTRFPPACLETYIPASATRMMSSSVEPCNGKLATPKLPVMCCSFSIGSVAIHNRRRSAKICACSMPVSGIRITNSSPP